MERKIIDISLRERIKNKHFRNITKQVKKILSFYFRNMPVLLKLLLLVSFLRLGRITIVAIIASVVIFPQNRVHVGQSHKCMVTNE